MPLTPEDASPAQIASQAEFIVNHLQETHYTYDENIDPETGTYDCDCSRFVSWVLARMARDHFRLLTDHARTQNPLAFDYFQFFESLTPESTGGWHQIDFLADARRGDIIAWQLTATFEKGHDSGHVFFVAETPSVNDEGIFMVRVYDSASKPHFEDTRGEGKAWPDGVGTGFINFQVDEDGRPAAFQFSPGAGFKTYPITIGRLEPLTASIAPSR